MAGVLLLQLVQGQVVAQHLGGGLLLDCGDRAHLHVAQIGGFLHRVFVGLLEFLERGDQLLLVLAHVLLTQNFLDAVEDGVADLQVV